MDCKLEEMKLEEMLKTLKDHGVTFSLCYDAKTKTYTLTAYDYIRYDESAKDKRLPVPLWTDIYSDVGDLMSHCVNIYKGLFYSNT